MATIYLEIGALLVALFLLFLLFKLLKNPVYLIANSVVGIVVFLILNAFGLGIPIDIFSVGIVAIGGLTGLVLVVVLHILGLGF